MVRPFAQAVKLFVGDNHNKLWMKSKRPQEVTGLAKAYSRNRPAKSRSASRHYNVGLKRAADGRFRPILPLPAIWSPKFIIRIPLQFIPPPPRATLPGYSGPDETGNGVEGALRYKRLLIDSGGRCICSGMIPIFDMDDRARLPWRFFGATLTILARLWGAQCPVTSEIQPL